MRRLVTALVIAILTAAASIAFAQAKHPISGRTVAGVMGHEGARWLERRSVSPRG